MLGVRAAPRSRSACRRSRRRSRCDWSGTDGAAYPHKAIAADHGRRRPDPRGGLPADGGLVPRRPLDLDGMVTRELALTDEDLDRGVPRHAGGRGRSARSSSSTRTRPGSIRDVREMNWIWAVGAPLVRAVIGLVFRVRIEGVEHVPQNRRGDPGAEPRQRDRRPRGLGRHRRASLARHPQPHRRRGVRGMTGWSPAAGPARSDPSRHR